MRELEPLVSFNEAFQRVIESATPLKSERIPLAQSLHRILDQDVKAARDFPPFDRVAMDGFAVTNEISTQRLNRFRIVTVCHAGDPPLSHPGGSCCVKVMTGAVVPRGASIVIPVEDVQQDGEEISIPEGLELDSNICKRGEDVRAGEVLIRRGRAITPAMWPVMASAGCITVKVKKRPSVGIVSTGSELVSLGQKPKGWQVMECNGWTLDGLLNASGLGESHPWGSLDDEPEAMRRGMADAMREFDVVVFSGGVSMGDRDLLPHVAKSLRCRLLFHGVAIKPGKPLLVAQKGKALLFGLPGNPVSAFTTAMLFVLPALRALAGHEGVLPSVKARLVASIRRDEDRTLLPLARLSVSDDGTLLAARIPTHGSGDVPSLVEANAIAVIPPGKGSFPAGGVVDVVPSGCASNSWNP